jgi:hypothetical protein
MRRVLSRPRCPPRLAGVGVMLGLLAYLLPLYGGVPGRGPAGATDRTPGILFARHRQVHLDAAADERPLPRPFAPALSPVPPPAVAAPEPATCSAAGAARIDLVSRPPSPGGPRSPPLL